MFDFKSLREQFPSVPFRSAKAPVPFRSAKGTPVVDSRSARGEPDASNRTTSLPLAEREETTGLPLAEREQTGPFAERTGTIYLDGPAGSQVPQCVIDAISDYYKFHNANRAGQFATSHQTDALLQEAHRAAADWFGTNDPNETVFGANMTTLTFQFSRAISRYWNSRDTVVVTRLDHDANVSPWRLAAEDRGAAVRTVDVHTEDATLDLEDFARALELRPKLVAVTAASNSVGSRTPIKQLIEMAHAAGAEVYVDRSITRRMP